MPNIIIKDSNEDIIKYIKVKNVIVDKMENDKQNIELLSKTFINNVLPMTHIKDSDKLKKCIENYIQHNIYDIESKQYKILDISHNDKYYKVYLSGKVDGFIINDKKKILLKIINKKRFSSLNYYEKIKFELYLRLYELNKIACIQICNHNIFPLYYERDDELYNNIIIKLKKIVLKFLKNN